jgi:site-specific recombinase XerD
LRELSGKERPTILNKVPANESIEALIKVARDTRPEAKREYDKQNNQLMYLRDIAILESLKCTGARVGELCSLTRKDLDKTNHRARVLGKGNKERWIYFSNVAWESLEEYLSARTKLARTVNPNLPRNWDTSDQPLFARHDRGSGISKVKPISPRSIQIIVESLAERADLEGNITPHKFRHWVATRLLSATGDLAATQDILGHSSPNTTRIYAQVSEQIKQTLHREVFG